MKYLRRQFIEAWMFFLVPGVAALLPWSLGWRWLRWWAQCEGGPFNEPACAASAVAAKYLDTGDERVFRAAIRMTWLIDYCDLYLSITRWRRAWLPWHVSLAGAWPQQGAFIAVGFHHGTCHWVFKSLAATGHDSMVISVRWERSDYKGYPMRYWYGRLRYWDMQRLGRRPVAYRPGIKSKLCEALRSGTSVVGLIDLPPRLAPRGRHDIALLGQNVSFPEGVVAIARESGVPVVPYWIEFDEEMRTRRFCIGEPLDPADTDATLRTLAGILDRQIRRSPHAWFFWPEWPRWLADSEAARSETGKEES